MAVECGLAPAEAFDLGLVGPGDGEFAIRIEAGRGDGHGDGASAATVDGRDGAARDRARFAGGEGDGECIAAVVGRGAVVQEGDVEDADRAGVADFAVVAGDTVFGLQLQRGDLGGLLGDGDAGG